MALAEVSPAGVVASTVARFAEELRRRCGKGLLRVWPDGVLQ